MKGVKGSTLSLCEEEAIRRILLAIKDKEKRLNCSLEFFGFAEIWHGTTTKLILHCKLHNYTWRTTTYNNFMKKSCVGCRKCKAAKTIKTHMYSPEEAYNILVDKYKSAGIDKYDFSSILTTYTGMHKKVKIRCRIHDEEIECYYSSLYMNVHGNHCPKCYDEFRRTFREKPIESFNEQIENKISLLSERGFSISFLGYNLRDDEHHVTTNTKIVLKCNIHDLVWKTSSVSGFTNTNGVFCPECARYSKKSNGEKFCYNEVLKYVPRHRVSDSTIISFSDPRFYNVTNTILPDIYITIPGKSDIIIEYDGEQHYRFVEHIHKEFEKYIRQVRRDQFLEAYCKKNNIKLLRIPWKDENRIPEIIRSFLVDGIDITTKVYPKIPPVVIINK